MKNFSKNKQVFLTIFQVTLLGVLAMLLNAVAKKNSPRETVVGSDKEVFSPGLVEPPIPYAHADTPAPPPPVEGSGSGASVEGSSGASGCEGSSSCCFRGAVLVAVAVNSDGSIKGRKIKDIVNGDTVLGAEFDGSPIGRPHIQPVRVVEAFSFENKARTFVKISAANGASVEAITSHPFVVSKEEEGVRAQALTSANKLFTIQTVPRVPWWGAKRSCLSRERVLGRSEPYTDSAPVHHLKTESENFFVSGDGVTYFLVLNGK